MNIQLSERARVFASGLAGATLVSMLTFTVVEALSPENLLRRDGRAEAEIQMAGKAEQAIMRA
jgi:hypothetical protein